MTPPDVDRNAATLATELCDFIAAEVALDDLPVEPDTDLLLTGLVDSLGVLRIVDFLEERLDIDIDPADVILDHFQTVDQMVAYVDHRTS